MAVRVFSIDGDGARGVVSDLVDALDVCGYGKPLENWTDSDSRLSVWAAGIDEDPDPGVEPVDVIAEWHAQLDGLKKSILAAQIPRQARALACLEMAREEFLECCTYEED